MKRGCNVAHTQLQQLQNADAVVQLACVLAADQERRSSGTVLAIPRRPSLTVRLGSPTSSVFFLFVSIDSLFGRAIATTYLLHPTHAADRVGAMVSASVAMLVYRRCVYCVRASVPACLSACALHTQSSARVITLARRRRKTRAACCFAGRLACLV